MSGKYNGLEKLIDHTPIICPDCGGAYEYEGAGEYKCKNCGRMDYDDYGKVRKYIEDNGPAPYHVVKKATGVDGRLVKSYLNNPSEATQEFRYKCSRCNCSIKQGTLCSSCKKIVEAGSSFAKKNKGLHVRSEAMRFLSDRNNKR